jgi:uncharacterized membrane protein
MKYLATYLTVLFFAGCVLSSMTHMTNDTHEAKVAHTLCQMLGLAFVFNLGASIALWLDMRSSTLIAGYVLGHLALAAGGFSYLRAAGKDAQADDETQSPA